MLKKINYDNAFDHVLKIGRPPNITRLFPNSRALLVSGKYIDAAMLRKGRAICMAANARNHIVLRGVLRAAQKARSCLILEIAKSEGGSGAYCDVSFWNLARQADAVCNELGLTVPIAIHADHYGIKSDKDLEAAKTEIPTLFEAGMTSIAVDASHQPDDLNLLANLVIDPFIPDWAGLETEVGEIKGKEGLSTPEEALFLIRGLNAHGIFPNWIALNNGTTHGIEAEGHGIQVDLTAEIHTALESYYVSGAQHGTSGNSSEKLRNIAEKTRTTKANVATALQMLSWGVEVNDYGNAVLNDEGGFQKIVGEGVEENIWKDMVDYAAAQGWKGGNYKKLNRLFENRILGQPQKIRERMIRRVEDFTYQLLVDVFNSENSADHVFELIMEAGSYDPGTKAKRIEDAAEWTADEIKRKARLIHSDKGSAGDFDD